MFLIALKNSKGPIVWPTSSGPVVLAFQDEELAHYFLSQSASRRVRCALVLEEQEAAQRLPLLPTINRLLHLRSYETIDSLRRDAGPELKLKLVQSPWWDARKRRKAGRVFTLSLE